MVALTNHGSNTKMKEMLSLNTACSNNPFCKSMQKNKTSICNRCYGKRYEAMYPSLKRKLIRNGKELSKEMKDIPKYNAAIIRFNAFGELLNITHLENLVKITVANPRTTFALWTKRKDFVAEYFSSNPKPENLILVYSSPILDVQEALPPFFDKVFTVFSKNENINCGAKSCFDCQLCYTKNETVFIREFKK